MSEIVQWFKTMTTNAYIKGVKVAGWPAFQSRLWQRKYYERIIGQESELQEKGRYIANNPLQWALDEENPTASE